MKYTQILFFLLLLNLISVCYTQGQTPQIDSLKAVTSKSKEDSNKVKYLIEIAQNLTGKDLNQMLEYSKQAYALSEKIDYKKGKALSNKLIGMYYYYVNKFGETTTYWEQSLKIYTSINDEIGMANMLSNLGSLNFSKGNPERALKYYFPAIDLAKKTGDKRRLVAIYQNIGLTYAGNLSTYDQAIINFNKSLEISKEIKEYQVIGMTYMSIGELYIEMGKDSLALFNLMKSKQVFEEINSPNLPYVLNSFGRIYQKKKIYEKALEYHIEALKKSKEGKNNNSIMQSDLEIAEIYRLKKQNALALKYFKEANTISKEESANNELKRSYEGLASTYNQLTDFRNAYYNQLNASLIADTLYKTNIDYRRMAIEGEIKEGEIRALQMMVKNQNLEVRNQKNVKNFFFGLTGFLIIGLILAINNIKRKRTNILLQKQKVEIENTLADLKSAQRQLIQSEKMASLGEMTAGIAHEIQNPLNFVNNFSEVNKELLADLHLEMDKGNLPEMREIAKDLMQNTEKINQHGRRADSIVKGMLQHSRTSTGQKESIDINSFIDEFMHLAFHGQRAKDKSFNVNLQTDYDYTIGKVNMNPQDIGRVMLNIFNNAFYAVTEKKKKTEGNFEPTVTVTTKKAGNTIEICVKDNGMGIPDKVKEKIFQPFFTTKPTGQGTGLGLSLSYDIIKAHQGSLTVNSKEGEFTEFTIQLPV